MRAAALLILAAVLAGCSSGGNETLEKLSSVIGPELFKPRAQREAEIALLNAAVTADPEGLRNFEAPILVIDAEDIGAVAVIGPLVTRGDESLWYSADNNSVGFRNGLVVATRGLVGDLQSAAEPDIRRTRGPAVRDHYYRDGDEVIRRYRYYCEITDKGPASAEVLDRIYPTRLIEESCAGEGQTFTNAYWIGTGGEIRLSRQWVGPKIGHFKVLKVQD